MRPPLRPWVSVAGSPPLPVLIMNGEHVPVSPTLDAQALATVAAHNRDITLYLPPEANHVFKHEPRPVTEIDPASVITGYGAADIDLDPDALAHLVAWLSAHAG